MAKPSLRALETYEEVRAAFRWEVPERFNIAQACCDVWASAEPGRTALIEVGANFEQSLFTFEQLRRAADQLAQALLRAGIRRGDRVAILLSQGRHVPIAHMAAYKIGAIALPLAALFGADAIAYRLADSGARIIITDRSGVAKLPAPGDGNALEAVICVEGEAQGAMPLAKFIEGVADRFDTVSTSADHPALMIYTSGTTGQPKGALHAHRVLLGHLPGFEMSHDFCPQPGDRLWTPAGLGLGGWIAEYSAAGPLFRHSRRGLAVPEVRSRGELCDDAGASGSQRLHSAHWLAADAQRGKPRGALWHTAAHAGFRG